MIKCYKRYFPIQRIKLLFTDKVLAGIFAISLLAVLSVDCGFIRHDTDTVRIMTFNIHHGEGVDGIYNINRIADFVKMHSPDIVMLQEVDRAFSDRSANEDQPSILAERLGYHYYYGPNIGDNYGNMIMSRYPLDGASNISLPNPDAKEPRGLITVTIEIGHKPVVLFCTHLSAFSELNRDHQVATLVDILEQQDHPVICGGDFNTLASEQLSPLLVRETIISSRNVFGLEEGIDDILVSSDLTNSLINGKIIETEYSDHPAYIVDCRIP